MDYQIANSIKACFWQGRSENARKLVDEHLNEIDFDDDDDVESLIELIISSFREEKNASFLEFLISKGFDINYKLLKKECLILKCAKEHGITEQFKEMVKLGADPYSESSDGDNILLIASEADEELAVYIAETFELSQLDIPDKFGITPLMHAIIKGRTKLVKALTDNGSDVNAAGTEPVGGNGYWIKTNGLTPLALAIRHGDVETVKLLLDAGADETQCDAAGIPPVFSLVYYPFRFLKEPHFNSPLFDKKCEIVPLMKNLELTDSRGYTVLLESLCTKDVPYTQIDAYASLPITLALIENGADVNKAANDGTRPIHLAVQSIGGAEKALVKAGADINAQDNNGNTALIIACKHCSEKTVRWLLKSGADFNIKNNAGETAADIAAARGFNDALEMMI